MSSVNIEQTLHTAIRHHEAGRLAEAEAGYRQILAQQPNNADALHLLGMIANHVGQNAVAEQLIRRAIALKPTMVAAYSNLGVVFSQSGKVEEAIAAFRQAAAYRPNDFEVHNNLAIALTKKGLIDEAIVSYQRALSLGPDQSLIYNNLGNALKDTGRLGEAIATFRRALQVKPTDVDALGNLILCMHYDPASDAAAIAAEERHWNRLHAEPLKQLIQPHLNDRDPNRRLRIGYLSGDFRVHAVGPFLLPLLSNHDRAKFELFAFSEVRHPDAFTDRLKSHFDRWFSTVGVPDTTVADLIRREKIDILIDLAMHTSGNRLPVFAYHPAPVQITWLAYPGSTGLTAMDYRISDPYLDPTGVDESVYSEKTVRLSSCFWCYRSFSGGDVPVHPLPAGKTGSITFGCLNNFCKVSDAAISLWAKILSTVPKSRLMICCPTGAARDRLVAKFVSAGIAADRLRFTPRVSTAEYFTLYHEIDIALDTTPFCGGTTTCDALWMGVPVVTLIGKTTVGRAGSSILSNVGLPELIARSADEYVQIATDLSRDLPRLDELRSSLRDRMKSSPLMNDVAFTNDMERVYRQVWSAWCNR